MPFSLGPAAQAAGYRVVEYDAVGSTNAEAQSAARAGDGGRLWIVTGNQTAGRGRRGRVWQGPTGNLAASLLLKPDLPLHRFATLGFVAGLAVADAVEACAPEGSTGRIALKWPNDLLADGAKFVGILLESETAADGATAVIVGIGVNVAAGPTGTPYPSTCLADKGWRADAETLFAALSESWIDRFSLWNEGRGMALIRDAWLARASGVGGPVSVSTGTDDIRGVFETLDAEGRLVVRQDDGTRVVISAGDVHFGAAATIPAAG